MTEPIYVSGQSGQEAIHLMIRNKDGARPEVADIQLSHHPILAWQIVPGQFVNQQKRGVPILPVSVFLETDWAFLLITMANGRVYSPDAEETYETLDTAVADCLTWAQSAWDREHHKGGW